MKLNTFNQEKPKFILKNYTKYKIVIEVFYKNWKLVLNPVTLYSTFKY